MSKPHTSRVAVVGSGLAGLSAAAVLAARGHSVTVFEKNAWLGGKAAQLNEHGFRFDMGPTILIQPNVLRRIFSEAGRKMEDYLTLLRLDPQWRCFFEDGSVLDLRDSEDDMAASLDGLHSGMGGQYRKLMQASRDLHEISNKFFFWKSVGGIRDTFELGGTFDPQVLRDILRMRMGRTVAGVIREHVRNDNVAQMLDHFTQYVGSSPDASPAILVSIGSMQMEEGISYPVGGTRAVPEALVKLGRELGVTYRTSVDVERIVVREGAVAGLQLTGGEYFDCDFVVSNADAVRTYRELIGGKHGEQIDHERDVEPACSGVVLYLGLNRRYEHLAHHNFVFSREPDEEFHAIYNEGEPAPDPTCYVAATAQSDADSAPPGGEALYVLVHTPYLRSHHDWRQMFPAYRRVILEKLKRTGQMPDLEDRIVYESALTPQDIHDRYRVLNGAIYGISSHGRWTGAFKPANERSDIRGLYLAGGAAHPGPGMPMVMMSGWIAADALDRNGREATATA